MSREPKWVVDDETRLTWLFKKAALYHDPSGGLERLCRSCGFSAPMAYRYIKLGKCSMKFAIAVEALVGSDVVTKEQLAPHAFTDTE